MNGYKESFQPEAELKADESTTLLYDSQHVEGKLVIDLSSHGHDGRWEDLRPGDVFPKADKHVLIFGGDKIIETPLERFAPVTLEAWILPLQQPDRCGFIIGSDVPTKFGIGMALCKSNFTAEYVAGLHVSEAVVPLRVWGHLSVVFGEQDTRLYHNGKHVSTGPATKITGGTQFVIGNLGRHNPIDPFVGQIRCLRISQGERYSDDFQPEVSFKPDAADDPHRAVLIYDGSKVERDRVLDVSGNGDDGRWLRGGD